MCPPCSRTTTPSSGGGRTDLVTTSNSIDASVDQTVAFRSYGLGSRIDLSVAIPFVTVDLAARSEAQVQRVGTATSPATHYCDDGTGGFGEHKTYRGSDHASGIGDVIVRLKGTAVHSDTIASVTPDVIPTAPEPAVLERPS